MNTASGSVPEMRYCEISQKMSSLYFGLAVFCQFEARSPEFDTQPLPPYSWEPEFLNTLKWQLGWTCTRKYKVSKKFLLLSFILKNIDVQYSRVIWFNFIFLFNLHKKSIPSAHKNCSPFQRWASYFQKVTSVDLVRWMCRLKRWKLSVESTRWNISVKVIR